MTCVSWPPFRTLGVHDDLVVDSLSINQSVNQSIKKKTFILTPWTNTIGLFIPLNRRGYFVLPPDALILGRFGVLCADFTPLWEELHSKILQVQPQCGGSGVCEYSFWPWWTPWPIMGLPWGSHWGPMRSHGDNLGIPLDTAKPKSS